MYKKSLITGITGQDGCVRTRSECSVLFIGTLLNEEIMEKYEIKYPFLAGNIQQRSYIESLIEAGINVELLTTIITYRKKGAYYPKNTVIDPELNVRIEISPLIELTEIRFLTPIIKSIQTIFWALLATFSLLNLTKNRKYDFILFYNFLPFTVFPAIVARILFGIPIVIIYNDSYIGTESIQRRSLAKILTQTFNRFIDGGFCVNKPLEKLLKTKNTIIIRGYPSIGMPYELPSCVHKSDKIVVMFSGMFDRIRGIDLFLEIIPEINKEMDGVEFWITGYGPDYDRIDKILSSITETNVKFFGTLPYKEFTKRIVSADILMNLQNPNSPESTYNFPSKLLDFMSAGKIIISTDMSDLREYFSEILIIDGCDSNDITVTLINTIKDLNIFQKYGHNGRNWVLENCNHKRRSEQIISIFARAYRDETE